MSQLAPSNTRKRLKEDLPLDSDDDVDLKRASERKPNHDDDVDGDSVSAQHAADRAHKERPPDTQHATSDPLNAAEEEQQLLSGTDRPRSSSRMVYYGREALCLLAILLTTMASYQGNSPKVGNVPSPRQFFPPDSLVLDYPSGNLDAVSQQVSLSELSFVLYYAPWDAASQVARQPFADVAQFFEREAHFCAINCWHPGGECRQQYSKIKAWPVLMAYLPKNGLGVLYNGPFERDPMMRFVNSFLKPLQRLNDPDDLLQAMTAHDALVVAFLDLQQDTLEWNVFYEAAVKWMYRDPFQDIRFSVVTGESRSAFGVQSGRPVLRMYLWNETLEYDNSTWTTTGVESWAMRSAHRVALWMTPSGYKSLSLSTFFKNGPVLLFFTPRNMLHESTDAQEMLRQLGMEYYNCHGDQWIREMVHEYLPEQRALHQEQLQKLIGYCQRLTTSSTTMRKSLSSVTFANLMNGSANQWSATAAREIVDDICRLESHSALSRSINSEVYLHCAEEACPTTKERLRETSMLNAAFDGRSPYNLEKRRMRRRCELLSIDAEQRAVHSFLGSAQGHQLEGIEGLGCTGNRSLTMLLMDSSIYSVFAERLGLDIQATQRRSAVFIVDPENESTYLLNPKEELNLESVGRFLKKFAEGSLRRHLRSSSHLNQINTHFYKATQPHRADERGVRTEELNSQNFKLAPGSANRSTLVFFYSSNCAFCTPMSQHLLQIQNILRPLIAAGHFEIFRIDGDKNDLPWPFTVAEYPTLLFLGGLSEDSRQFLVSERNSVALDKILGFIIANMKAPLRVYAIQLTCAASRRSVKSLVNCLTSLRIEIQGAISASLSEWRRTTTDRARVMRRLQLLEAFYLETFRLNEANHCKSCDFSKLERHSIGLVAAAAVAMR